jgi:hypothetical protein
MQLMLKTPFEIIAAMADDPDPCKAQDSGSLA